MSEQEPAPDNVLVLKSQFEKPTKEVTGKKREPKKDKDKSDAGGGGDRGGSPPPGPSPTSPRRLPPPGEGCPVQAMGTRDGLYYYLDHLGQLRTLKEPEHGRTQIIGLFGGTDYLNATWPVWELTDAGWVRKDDFKHSAMAPVLIGSCAAIGVWDPTDKIRGCGSWIEASGALVMHSGAHIFRSMPGMVHKEPAGISGDFLYPRRPNLPEPDFTDKEGVKSAGVRILEKLDTWTWERPDIDPHCALGWNVIALIAQAAPWRPVIWVRGAKGTGKSTLARFFEWLHSKPALVMPTNTTQAYVYQKLGDGSLPVLVDEFESKDDNNRRMEDVIELMRIAASGGELGRGGSENNPKTHVLKSSFAAFSINMPPLEPQDISRMAVLALKKLRPHEAADELDLTAPADHDLILGNRDHWAKVGRQLRARVLQQWPRFLQTFNAYYRALVAVGHDGRGAFQFGALGAGCDIALYDTLDPENAKAWAKQLPASELAETKGYVDEPQACLDHLLAATPDPVRGREQENVSYYLRRAREDMERDDKSNDPEAASRLLAKIGLRVYRDATLVDATRMDRNGKPQPVWWVAVSSTHPGLIEIFKGTKWRGRSGTPGAWVRALRGLDGVTGKAKEKRIGPGRAQWVTEILWDCVFPPFGGADDADEIATVMASDRQLTGDSRDV